MLTYLYEGLMYLISNSKEIILEGFWKRYKKVPNHLFRYLVSLLFPMFVYFLAIWVSDI